MFSSSTAAGKQIAGFDIAVKRDLNGIRTAIKQALPDADIHVEGIGEGVILTGTVANAAESQQAFDIAVRLLNDADAVSIPQGSKIVNAIVIRGRDQVMLKVTVAEVERDIVKQLGINLSGTLGYGTAVVNFNNTNPFSAYGQSLSGSAINGSWKNITATLQAMEQAGVIHLLAEPNLTAISGETATFVAGGQFPILNGYSCSATSNTPGAPTTCQPSISFKNFGVSLNFTPVVLSDGRISLKVMTEVSDLSSNNSLVITQPGTTATATIPSIRTRRADTTVEIPSGGSLAMAGHDSGRDPAQHQRLSGPDGASHSRPVVQEQRLRQSAHRADDPGDALHRARGCPGRICRGPTTVSPIPAIRRRCCSAISIASTASAARPNRHPTPTTAITASSSIDAGHLETADALCPHPDHRSPRRHAARAAHGLCCRLRRAGVWLQHRPADYRRSGRAG